MHYFLAFVLALSTYAQAAQVTLREGETGQLGRRTLQVLRVDDQRCGPLEDCLATVTAKVRVTAGGSSSVVVVSLPASPAQTTPWSGLGVVRVDAATVTLTNQRPGSSAPGEQLTLRRGETGRLGPRLVKVQGWDVRECPRQLLCVSPKAGQVYVWVTWGSSKNWLALPYPAATPWPGIALTHASTGEHPALTFADSKPAGR